MSGQVVPSGPRNLIASYPAATRLSAKAKTSAKLTELLTVGEVAAQLKVCKATVYTLCASGKLEHVRVMNVIRVPKSALQKLLRGGK